MRRWILLIPIVFSHTVARRVNFLLTVEWKINDLCMLYGNKLFFHEYDAKAFFYSNLKTYVLFPVDWAVNALTKLCFQKKKAI